MVRYSTSNLRSTETALITAPSCISRFTKRFAAWSTWPSVPSSTSRIICPMDVTFFSKWIFTNYIHGFRHKCFYMVRWYRRNLHLHSTPYPFSSKVILKLFSRYVPVLHFSQRSPWYSNLHVQLFCEHFVIPRTLHNPVEWRHTRCIKSKDLYWFWLIQNCVNIR